MSVTPEIKIKSLILITLRSASKQGLTYNTVFSHLDYLLARSGNDKTWQFAIGRDGVYSVARSMVTDGLLNKFSFNKPNRILQLTLKGRRLADKIS